MRTHRSIALAGALAALLCACGGSGGGTNAIPSTTGSSSPAKSSNITFVLHIPATASPSAAAMSVTIAAGTQVLTTSNISATSSLCTAASGGGRNCTIGVSAPVGSDTFTITAYDQANGAGTAIAGATMVETVSTTPVTVNVAVSGTIVKLAVALSNPYPPAGTAAASLVTVTGVDADGNQVLGPYASPISLSDSDTSGATSLSTTTLTSSSNTATLNYNGAISDATITITASMSGAASATASFAAEPAYGSVYNIPGVSSPFGQQEPGVWAVAKGSDGNIWAGCTGVPEVIRVTSSGSMTVFALPGSGPGVNSMALGSDGNIWVANEADSGVDRITPAGVVTSFPIQQAGQTYANPDEVAQGPDGNIWFDDSGNGLYGKITPSGTITEYAPYPQGAAISAITAGPDGNLWMVDQPDGQIWKVSPSSGAILATYTLPSANANPDAIAAGPDGNLWVTEQSTNKIARVSTSGTIAEFTIPTSDSWPLGIAAGPDGRMWFGEQGPPTGIGKIGYITTDGTQIRDFVGGSGFKIHGLVFSGDTLWYIALAAYNPVAGNVVGTFQY